MRPKDIGRYRLILIQGTRRGRMSSMRLHPNSTIIASSKVLKDDMKRNDSEICPWKHIITISGYDDSKQKRDEIRWQIAFPSEEVQQKWLVALQKARLFGVSWPNRDEIVRLIDLAKKMRSNVDAKRRIHRFKLYPRCFIGSRAVRWIVKYEGCSSSQAMIFGQKMLSLGLIKHITDEHVFCNKKLLYQFPTSLDPFGAMNPTITTGMTEVIPDSFLSNTSESASKRNKNKNYRTSTSRVSFGAISDIEINHNGIHGYTSGYGSDEESNDGSSRVVVSHVDLSRDELEQALYVSNQEVVTVQKSLSTLQNSFKHLERYLTISTLDAEKEKCNRHKTDISLLVTQILTFVGLVLLIFAQTRMYGCFLLSTSAVLCFLLTILLGRGIAVFIWNRRKIREDKKAAILKTEAVQLIIKKMTSTLQKSQIKRHLESWYPLLDVYDDKDDDDEEEGEGDEYSDSQTEDEENEGSNNKEYDKRDDVLDVNRIGDTTTCISRRRVSSITTFLRHSRQSSDSSMSVTTVETTEEDDDEDDVEDDYGEGEPSVLYDDDEVHDGVHHSGVENDSTNDPFNIQCQNNLNLECSNNLNDSNHGNQEVYTLTKSLSSSLKDLLSMVENVNKDSSTNNFEWPNHPILVKRSQAMLSKSHLSAHEFNKLSLPIQIHQPGEPELSEFPIESDLFIGKGYILIADLKDSPHDHFRYKFCLYMYEDVLYDVYRDEMLLMLLMH